MSVKYVLSRKVKTHGIISAVAASLFLFSAGVLADNQGPACNLPVDEQSTDQWAQKQDEKTGTGHLVTCHIGKDYGWLKRRSEGNEASCSKASDATSWDSAALMWKYVGGQITSFCKTDTTSTHDFVIRTDLKGDGAEIIGKGYNKKLTPSEYEITNDGSREAVTVLRQENNRWFVLTSYLFK